MGQISSKSILQGEEKACYITGSTQNLDKHHIYHGPRRRAAEIWGCWVWLRHDIHRMLHDKGLYDDDLKEVCQARFEQMYSHEAFMQVFGKNYLRNDGHNCGSCKEFDGAHCMRWWNNLDRAYYIPWRDDKDETDYCENWEAIDDAE